MQTSASKAVSAIRAIAQKVQNVQGLTVGILAAVEQQTSATGNIARNVHQAATGCRQVVQNVEQVTAAAKKTSDEALSMEGTSDRLRKLSNQLDHSMQMFLATIHRDRKAA